MALTIAFKAHLLAASLRAAIAIQQITVITFFRPAEGLSIIIINALCN